jgi:hypothetical protein
MEQYTIVILFLLWQVIIDGLGDGFRVRKWQRPHHSMETLRIGGWLAYPAALSLGWVDFQWYYIAMYILGRIWAFDLVYNLVARNKLFYVSKTSWDGVILWWISGEDDPGRKNRWPIGMVASMPKMISLLWWMAWFLTDGGWR